MFYLVYKKWTDNLQKTCRHIDSCHISDFRPALLIRRTEIKREISYTFEIMPNREFQETHLAIADAQERCEQNHVSWLLKLQCHRPRAKKGRADSQHCGPPSFFSVELLACLQLLTEPESMKVKSQLSQPLNYCKDTLHGHVLAPDVPFLSNSVESILSVESAYFDMANFRYLRTFIDEESSHGAVLYRIPSCPNLGVQIADEKEEEKQWLSDYVTALEVRSQTLTPVLPLPAAQEEIPEMPVPVEGDQVQIQSDAATLPVTTVGNGSRGHPFLCRRPCVRLAKGNCHMGDACGYCHHQTHRPFASLDKRRRVHLRSMDTFSVCYANTFLISGGKN